MNDKEYLAKILNMCTPTQKGLYARMYPGGGPDDDQTQQAIRQVENTIYRLNDNGEKLRDLKGEFNTYKLNSEAKIGELEKLLSEFGGTVI